MTTRLELPTSRLICFGSARAHTMGEVLQPVPEENPAFSQRIG
jgi:hypothetical protein